MTISLSDNSPRVNYTVNQGVTQATFTVPFEFFDDADLNVFVDGTKKTLTTHYTTSDDSGDSQDHTSGTTGFVQMTTGNAVTGASGGSSVVITRDIDIDRTTDFPTSGPFDVATLNTELDRMIAIAADIDDAANRALILADSDTTASLILPDVATRANKQLGFDGSGDLVAEEGKVSSVTASVSAVSPGGSPTASATFTSSTGALALAFGLVTGTTGDTGSGAGMQLTFSNSTSDADPGAGKLALNNGTMASVTQMYFDDVDDNGAAISTFVQSFDNVVNSTARGIIYIEKEGTPATFALFKVTGAVTDASGYTKVPVTHLVNNGTFSNSDGIRVAFTYSGADGTAGGGLSDIVSDTTPQLGGDLDVNGKDIVTTSNADIELNPNGTGKTVLKGNTNPGTLVFNCESNTHGQTVKSQPHSATVTNTLTLPPGGDGELVSTVATQTLTNKSIAATQLTGALPAIDGSNLTGISAGATGGGSDQVFYENGQTVTTNYTITNGKNAMSAGPITINSGVTVTVGSGETYTVV